MEVFPWKSIWVSGAPSKVVFFLWIVALGRNLTIDNLVRRGHVSVNRCCMCCADAESVNHLFLHCSVTSRLWALFFLCVELLGCSQGEFWSYCAVGGGFE